MATKHKGNDCSLPDGRFLGSIASKLCGVWVAGVQWGLNKAEASAQAFHEQLWKLWKRCWGPAIPQREGICTPHFPPVECLKCWGVCKKSTKHPRPFLGMLAPLTVHREEATPTAVQRSRWSRVLAKAFCWQCLPRHPLPQSRGVAVACLISYIFFLI